MKVKTNLPIAKLKGAFSSHSYSLFDLLVIFGIFPMPSFKKLSQCWDIFSFFFFFTIFSKISNNILEYFTIFLLSNFSNISKNFPLCLLSVGIREERSFIWKGSLKKDWISSWIHCLCHPIHFTCAFNINLLNYYYQHSITELHSNCYSQILLHKPLHHSTNLNTSVSLPATNYSQGDGS